MSSKETIFEKSKWNVNLLGDHAIVFSLTANMQEEIIEKIIELKNWIELAKNDFIIESIPSYHTLTLVYDIQQFYKNKIAIENNHSIIAFANSLLTQFELTKKNNQLQFETEKKQENNSPLIIRIPVCYDLSLGIDLENLSTKNNISINEIIKKHCEEIYLVYCLGFLPGFAYMGKVNTKIQIARHASPRKEVMAGSVGIAGEQTGIYPMNSPGGWQIIGRTPLKIFDPNPSVLGKLQAGDRIQFYPIDFAAFEKLNEYK